MPRLQESLRELRLEREVEEQEGETKEEEIDGCEKSIWWRSLTE